MSESITPEQRKRAPHPAWARIAHAVRIVARILGAILVKLFEWTKVAVVWFFIGAVIGLWLFDRDE